ncbi:ATP-binding cassette domain-containing protein [Ureibacillus aquaedulcis]|uniref:ABC transporter ATP-binding protein n=1 Tax=Ureibacillus aquaedulcis TaxID=3058421 RepID=A0ABT8GSN5_9BACL|nr:ABC transporter ATP-binding protein [Ureibacillus sp. BA0131]MDN4494418.1 ABC transporter ATP-binding protein [Ureibacillus sp. BA0131]
MDKNILEVSNVSKEIGGKKILKNITFTCEDYTTLAIRGSNGSGKSTLLKILAGIYEPTSGVVNRGNRKVGYVTEHFPESLRFKLKEYLILTASFQNIPKQQIEEDLIKYIEMFNLQAHVNTPLKKCSKGTKQKVGIIQALMMKPDILLLDEPLTGLDSATQSELFYLLEKLKKQVTIIFTTHEEKMIESLADAIFSVESGEVLHNPQFRTLQKLIKVNFKDQSILRKLNPDQITYEGNTAFITVDTTKSDELLLALLNNNCSILEVKERREV